MSKVIIMRGPSGVGKSTYIKENHPNAIVVSADNFWWTENLPKGVDPSLVPSRKVDVLPLFSANNERSYTEYYVYDVTKISQAHADCMRQFIVLLNSGPAIFPPDSVKDIVVDNTNIEIWEYTNYELLAKFSGRQVEIVEIMPATIDDLRESIRRNEHSVPSLTVAGMTLRFQPDLRSNVTKVTMET